MSGNIGFFKPGETSPEQDQLLALTSSLAELVRQGEVTIFNGAKSFADISPGNPMITIRIDIGDRV